MKVITFISDFHKFFIEASRGQDFIWPPGLKKDTALKSSITLLPVTASLEETKRSWNKGKGRKHRLCVRGVKYISYF